MKMTMMLKMKKWYNGKQRKKIMSCVFHSINKMIRQRVIGLDIYSRELCVTTDNKVNICLCLISDKPQQVQQVQTRRTCLCQLLRTVITCLFYTISLIIFFLSLLYVTKNSVSTNEKEFVQLHFVVQLL